MGSCTSIFNMKKTQLDIDPSKLPTYTPNVRNPVVIKVYDGDTITVAGTVAGSSTVYKFSVRLKGIDCPEMKTKNISEKYVATKAKEFVSNMCFKKHVILKNCQNDKYGRLLADVYINKKNIAEELIKKRLAVEYDGGTKHVPENWENYHFNRI